MRRAWSPATFLAHHLAAAHGLLSMDLDDLSPEHTEELGAVLYVLWDLGAVEKHLGELIRLLHHLLHHFTALLSAFLHVLGLSTTLTLLLTTILGLKLIHTTPGCPAWHTHAQSLLTGEELAVVLGLHLDNGVHVCHPCTLALEV